MCRNFAYFTYLVFLTVVPVTAKLEASAAFVTQASSDSQAATTPTLIKNSYASNLAENHSTGSELTHILASFGLLTDLSVYVRDKPSLVYARDTDGWTMLHEAAAHGHIPVVDYLLQRGADLNAETYGGQSALDLAEAHLTSDSPMVRYLMAQGGVRTESDMLALRQRLRGNAASESAEKVGRHQF